MTPERDPFEPKQRVIGDRRPAEAGRPPPVRVREAMTEMANYRTRVPKGVFLYRSHEEANQDWERWRIATMLANTKVKSG